MVFISRLDYSRFLLVSLMKSYWSHVLSPTHSWATFFKLELYLITCVKNQFIFMIKYVDNNKYLFLNSRHCIRNGWCRLQIIVACLGGPSWCCEVAKSPWNFCFFFCLDSNHVNN